MNQHLFVKIRNVGPHQLIVAYMDVGEGREQGCGSFANLGNRLTKAGPMSEAIASPKAPTFGGSYLRLAS